MLQVAETGQLDPLIHVLFSSISHVFILSAPVASLIIHRRGYRVTMFAGGIIAATGLLICVFAESICVILLCLGFMMGITFLFNVVTV